jgi:hypothetical protein
MKKLLITIGTLFFITGNLVLQAQTLCKVLKPEISGTYTGSCKQGLADGLGEATGEDFYRGEFVKGLPDGTGTYLWKNGATYEGEWKKGRRDGDGTYTYKSSEGDSILAGRWKNDKYLGVPLKAPYVIEYRNNIGRVSCTRIADRPYVKYKFLRNGIEANIFSNVLMQGSSGTESNTGSFVGFEQVTFPFKGKLTFTAPNSFMSATLSCELRLTINEPGAWIVTIFY